MMGPFKILRELLTFHNRGRYIEQQVRRERGIIYGQQSVRKQAGFFARDTVDYDIYTRRQPRSSARRLERTLDKESGADLYYTRPSQYTPGVFKVFYKGADHRKGTEDDIGIADFSRQTKRVPYIVRGGVRYATLNKTLQDKQRTVRDPRYAYRAEKDRADAQEIRSYLAYQRSLRIRPRT